MKTASRIVGTAAFRAGFQSQDSPVYGAERRGAAVVAYTRISDLPILERGGIREPHLILLADETLLDDAQAGVLSGAETATGIFLNTARTPAEWGPRLGRVPITLDVTSRTRQVLGRPGALSAGLAAAAARLCGRVPQADLVAAIRDEFAELGVSDQELEANLTIARDVFAASPPLEFHGEPPTAPSAALATVSYDGVLCGTPSVLIPGNAAERHTGNWRVERPVVDSALCTRCGLCFVQCPEGTIVRDEQGYPVIDYDHCKGCMICQTVCPVAAVGRELETAAW